MPRPFLFEKVRIVGRDDVFLVLHVDEANEKVNLLSLRYDCPDEVNVAYESLTLSERLHPAAL